ncbi:MAG: zinc ribbon domain-containing protein [Anaerolineae bacterium]|nr:zinc ribbon domain-containing protein [Anaerolineae bacterium]
MIYCPNCGTANRDGSSFCNQCGQRLGGGSKATCPFCGAENPIENIFCDACGAKLAPLVTPGVEEKEKPTLKGLSLPTKPAGDEEGVPDSEAAVPQEPSAPEGEEEIPDWLARLRASLGEASEPAEEPPATEEFAAEVPGEGTELPEEELPDWLRELRAQPAPEEAGEEQVAPAVEEFAAAVPDEGAELPEEELPDWLRELRAQPAPEEEAPAVEEFAAEVPEQESPAEPEAEEVAPPVATPALAEQPEAEAPTAGIPALSEGEQPAAEVEPLAAWLQEEGPVILELSEEEMAEGGKEAPPVALGPDVPAWLETLASGAAVLPEELGPVLPTPGKPTPEEVGLERAAIPSWLEVLRPGRKREEGEEAPAEEPVETEGMLEGVRGALRLVPNIDPGPDQFVRAVSAAATVTPAHAETLTQVLARSTASSVRPRTVPVPRRERGLPWLAFLLLLAAVLIPLVAPGLVPGGALVPSARSAGDFAAQVQSLPPGAKVLISFDYDPSVSTELDWPVREVINDLKAKGATLLVMSTTPTGPGLAARMGLADTATLLGYLPGQEMGLQRLATSFSGAFLVDYQGRSVDEAALGVRSLGDMALIITAASSQDTVRWWVEQVGSQLNTPICAIVSGAIEPSVRPYYSSGQLTGLVSGWVGGLAYRQAISPDASLDAQGKAAVEAQSLGHLAIVVLIVLGNLAYWGKRLFGGRS